MSVASTDEQSLEARTPRKVITRAVPFLMATYFINYLDRTNPGNDKAGMWAVGVFMVISAVVVVALRAAPDPDT